MFCRSICGLIGIVVVAVVSTPYSHSAYITVIDPELTEYQIGSDNVAIDPTVTEYQTGPDNVESSTTEQVQEGTETSPVNLATLLDAGDGAVVTLVAGDTRLAVHRAVLVARSPWFASRPETADGEVQVPDVEGPVLRQLVSYLYILQAPQAQWTMALKLLAAADRFGVEGLRAECERQVAAQLTVETAAATAVLAVNRDYSTLRAAAVAFIRERLLHVMGTQGWRDAMRGNTEHLITVCQLLGQAARGRRQCSQPPATKAPSTATCPTDTPRDVDVSSLRNLPAEEKGKQLIKAAKEGSVEELQALVAAGADVETTAYTVSTELDGMTALHWAAWEGDVEAVRALLDAGTDVNIRSSALYTPLQVAAWMGREAVVRLLLASCADPNTANKWGWTPLHEAARHGNAEVAAALLAAGSDAGSRTEKGETPLELARRENHYKLVKMLRCREQSRGHLSTTTERARRRWMLRI